MSAAVLANRVGEPLTGNVAAINAALCDRWHSHDILLFCGNCSGESLIRRPGQGRYACSLTRLFFIISIRWCSDQAAADRNCPIFSGRWSDGGLKKRQIRKVDILNYYFGLFFALGHLSLRLCKSCFFFFSGFGCIRTKPALWGKPTGLCGSCTMGGVSGIQHNKTRCVTLSRLCGSLCLRWCRLLKDVVSSHSVTWTVAIKKFSWRSVRQLLSLNAVETAVLNHNMP